MQVLEANRKVKNICGISQKEIVGKNISEIKVLCTKSCHYVLKEILNTKSSIPEYLGRGTEKSRPGFQLVFLLNFYFFLRTTLRRTTLLRGFREIEVISLVF
jgi:hypothetical protein